jgi:hypothetical protein
MSKVIIVILPSSSTLKSVLGEMFEFLVYLYPNTKNKFKNLSKASLWFDMSPFLKLGLYDILYLEPSHRT